MSLEQKIDDIFKNLENNFLEMLSEKDKEINELKKQLDKLKDCECSSCDLSPCFLKK